MRSETKKWIEKARKDLETAEFNYGGERYEVAAFFCQQAVEKALKALSIERKGKFRKVHDLKLLGKEVNLPQKFISLCEEMTYAYVYTRYPDVVEVKDIKKEAKKFLKNAKVILRWIEKQL